MTGREVQPQHLNLPHCGCLTSIVFNSRMARKLKVERRKERESHRRALEAHRGKNPANFIGLRGSAALPSGVRLKCGSEALVWLCNGRSVDDLDGVQVE
jgi:hypothetical protein